MVKQGVPQWIAVNFADTFKIDGFTVQFQGGFSPAEIQLEMCSGETGSGSEHLTVATFYPNDSSSAQSFRIEGDLIVTKYLRFFFPKSCDTFGRIIVYKLVINGEQTQ